VLIDIFVRIEGFFKRLESYTAVPPTAAMTDVIVKIMIEILSILAIATKEIRQGRSSEYTALQYIICSRLTFFLEKFVKKLLGQNDIEEALKRLDTLTMEEARMAIAETLNVTHKIDDRVAVLVDGGRDTFFWSSTHS
jgi:Na+/phosphate symporter